MRTGGLLVLAMALSAPAAAATIKGRVRIEGSSERRLLSPSGAVVYLDHLPAGAAAPAPGRFTIETKNKKFTPPVLAVPVGSTVSFPNGDTIVHNVFSASGANTFDLGLYGKSESRSAVFREPGIVRVYCNVHEKMVAFVLVCPSQFFSLVRDDGSFEIAGAPAGTYDVKVWDEKGGLQSSSVTVAAGDTLEVGFKLDGTKYQREPHLDKNGKPYSARAPADYD